MATKSRTVPPSPDAAAIVGGLYAIADSISGMTERIDATLRFFVKMWEEETAEAKAHTLARDKAAAAE